MAAERAIVDANTVNTSGRPNLRRVEAVEVRRAVVPALDKQAEQLQIHGNRVALDQTVCIAGWTICQIFSKTNLDDRGPFAKELHSHLQPLGSATQQAT